MATVNHHLVEIALGRTDPTSFERFCQVFFAALTGTTFVPLGGHHDGGAEAFSDQGVFEEKAGHFWQASIEQKVRPKIRRTVRRIQEFGRDLKQLTYCSSIVIPNVDGEEDFLSDELGIRVRIRDQKYLISHINHDPQTVEAFNSYLAPHLAFLKEIGGVSMISYSPELPARSLCVFLGQEVERRSGNTQLLEAVTDSLILWALEGTDPDKQVFRTRSEILERIVAALPAANHFVRGVFDHRIEALSSKTNTNGRQVRWYRADDQFCLPYETRNIVEEENIQDEILKATVSEIFGQRAALILKDDAQRLLLPKAVTSCHRAIEIAFERQGLEIASFIQGNTDLEVQSTISDHVDQAMDELEIDHRERELTKDAAMHALRGALYHSEEPERIYFTKLSRTYTLLFILKNEPRIVEYFRRMSSDFVLYIGTDILIRALSEYFLPDADRMTWNMFKVLRAAGSELILTEKTLEELISHLRAADYEFRHHYEEMERYVDIVLARHIDRILIRAYFYAQLESRNRRLPGWAAFLGLFCTYPNLRVFAGQESLRRYLCGEFGMTFERTDETTRGVDDEELTALTNKITQVRGGRAKEREEVLASNDALHVLRVYAKRRELQESSKANPYGYRTWWLTQETLVRRATGEVVAKYHSMYMMRPEFILNFISIAPSAETVRASFGSIFPTLLGVRLSNRLRNETFEKVMQSVRDASLLGDARARALASELSDKLKGDQFKRYEVHFGASSQGVQ